MIWHFIDSGFNSGLFNMQFDLELANKCSNDEAFFRIYRWNPYCISLGANQSFNDVNLKKTHRDGIDVVKRPTGGRAILHAEELTYSVIVPVNNGFSPKQLYHNISDALIKGLELYNPSLASAELENIQPDFLQLLEEPAGTLCFASTAKNEVKFKGKKLIGSAQRKMNQSILQHGSILCSKSHRMLADYINCDEDIKNSLLVELAEKTTELESILPEKTDYDKLKKCLISGFEFYMQINFVDSI